MISDSDKDFDFNLALAKGVLILKLSCSFKKANKKTKTSIKHNTRKLTEDELKNPWHNHINPDKRNDNVVLCEKDIHVAYDDIFGEAVRKYNDKQKRKDRKIGNYLQKVKKDGNLQEQVELIVQVGSSDNFKSNPELKEVANAILIDYFRDFSDRNPNLVVYNAIIHNDEEGESPHLHLNVIPVAKGYKKGLEKQPSLNKALQQQGIEYSRENNKSLWLNFRNQEVAILENALNDRGIERKLVGTNHIKDVHEYKKIMSNVRKLEKKSTQFRSYLAAEDEKVQKQVNDHKKDLNVLETKLEGSEIELKQLESEIVNLKSQKEGLTSSVTDLEQQQQEIMRKRAENEKVALENFEKRMAEKEKNLAIKMQEREKTLSNWAMTRQNSSSKISRLVESAVPELSGTGLKKQKTGNYILKLPPISYQYLKDLGDKDNEVDINAIVKENSRLHEENRQLNENLFNAREENSRLNRAYDLLYETALDWKNIAKSAVSTLKQATDKLKDTEFIPFAKNLGYYLVNHAPKKVKELYDNVFDNQEFSSKSYVAGKNKAYDEQSEVRSVRHKGRSI